ncbi:MAG: hypothetical protein AB8G15_07180 [Saprospiraceae bacterium]
MINVLLSRKLDIVLLLLTLAWALYMKQAVALEQATQVIVDFELAGSLEKAQSIMKNIGPDGVQALVHSIYLDFVFLALYSTALALLYIRAASSFKDLPRLFFLGFLLAGLQWFAGAMDTLENRAMLYTLSGDPSTWYPYLAMIFAKIKFGILLLSIPYLLFSFLYWILFQVFSAGKTK